MKRNVLTVLQIGVATAALALSACFHQDSDEVTDSVVSGEKAVAMEGSGTFFKGDITAKITMSRGIGKGLKKSGRSKGDYTYESYTRSDSKSLLGTPVTPVTIRIALTNHTDHPMTVAIEDFDSDMGNFAVDPESLTIGPGQTEEPTQMVSDLGVISDIIPYTVTLRYGASVDTKVIQVVNTLVPPASPQK